MSASGGRGGEAAFFFPSSAKRLFGFLHRPAAAPGRTAAVLCPPFGEERVIAQRTLVGLARALAAAGSACLRFDYAGTGDSSGRFEEHPPASHLEDIAAALALLRESCPGSPAALVGLRFGAALALRACAAGPAPEALVLVDPVLDGRAYLEAVLRSNLATQLMIHKKVLRPREQLLAELRGGATVNVDGYLLSGAMAEQIAALDLRRLPAPPPCPVAVFETAAPGPPSPTERWCRGEDGAGAAAEYRRVAGSPWWKDAKVYRPRQEELEAAVVAWLGGR